MKDKYIAPEVEIIELKPADIICTSPGEDENISELSDDGYFYEDNSIIIN